MVKLQPPSTAPVETPAANALADFGALLDRSLAAERQAAEVDLDTVPAQLAELSRRFVALDRRLVAARRRMESLQGADERDAFAQAEFERILNVPGVRSASVEGSALVVTTEPVHISWSGQRYDLGAYRLVLDLAGDVRIESIDRRGPRLHWDHPHVQDGLPCLGNLREGVLKLVAEYELALTAQVLLDFLHSYQPETAYTPVESWPEDTTHD